jgi:hypothetical protein
MTQKPTIQELNNPEKFELLAEVEQSRIKDFVLQQVMSDKKIIPVYMVYQTILFLAGLFFLTRSIILAYRGNFIYLLASVGAVVFSFTLLVALHELLHALALKLTGVPKVTIGGIWKKFIFFAEADNFVLGKKAFLFVAFTPLILIQIVTVIGIVIWFYVPFLYFFLMVMTIHSFFCSGDVALVTIFYRFPGRDTFTYDNSAEKKSYYFVRKI